MSKRRFLKATEVEATVNKAREEGFLSGETTIISTIVETAKRNGRIGDKILSVVNPEWVHFPDWQRSLDLSRARQIGMNYNRHKWEVPKVIYSNGKLSCVDGMHRIFGAFLASIENIVVEIMEISETEAIDMFLNQTKDRGAMKPMDYYYASIKANKPEYISFRDICHKHNIQVKGDDTLTNPVGVFTSLSDGIRSDKEVLDKVLALINKLGWNGKETSSLAPSSGAYGAKVIRSMKKLYAYYEANESKMESILLSKCKGTEWFIKHIVDMPQYYVFDLLNKTVSDTIAQAEVINIVRNAHSA